MTAVSTQGGRAARRGTDSFLVGWGVRSLQRGTGCRWASSSAAQAPRGATLSTAAEMTNEGTQWEEEGRVLGQVGAITPSYHPR